MCRSNFRQALAGLGYEKYEEAFLKIPRRNAIRRAPCRRRFGQKQDALEHADERFLGTEDPRRATEDRARAQRKNSRRFSRRKSSWISRLRDRRAPRV
jgi:hypothetical protein